MEERKEKESETVTQTCGIIVQAATAGQRVPGLSLRDTERKSREREERGSSGGNHERKPSFFCRTPMTDRV